MPLNLSMVRDNWQIMALSLAGLWMVLSFGVSRMGWSSFSRRHRARTRPRGRAYRAKASWFRGFLSNYGSLTSVIFTESGVYVFPLFLIRPFHPPFLVPWSGVSRVEKKFGFFGQQYRMDIRDDAGEFHLILPGAVRDDLMAGYRKKEAQS
jgi:hypothetical protein